MNAYRRKLAGILAIGVLMCMGGALSPAWAQGTAAAATALGWWWRRRLACALCRGRLARWLRRLRRSTLRIGVWPRRLRQLLRSWGLLRSRRLLARRLLRPRLLRWLRHGGFYGPRWGFGWFLPVLPAFYATYWWGGVPYYYANDAYYTWNPGYNGYVATDPPAGPADNDAQPPPAGSPGPAGAEEAPAGGQTYNYPKKRPDGRSAGDRSLPVPPVGREPERL